MGRARAIGGTLATAVALASASGCQFDPSQRGNLDIGGADGGDPVNADTGPCDGLVARVSVDGITQPLAEDAPYTHVLLGDTVELSAAGSCSERGALSYSWRIEPQSTQVEATVLPSLSAETITLYPMRPESYIARLTVDDGSERTTVAVFAFQAHGFRALEQLPGGMGGEVDDLFVGASHLWIGTRAGAHRADLSAPEVGPYPSVEDLSGSDFSFAVAAVLEDQSGDAWFGRRDADESVWRLSGAELEAVGVGTDMRVRDLATAPGGVRLAGDRGVFLSSGGDDFEQERGEDSYALGTARNATFSGGDKLYPVPDGDPLEVFGSGNNKIRALAGDGDVLWVGSDDQGVARVDSDVTELFTTSDWALPSDKIRALAVDASGDVWAATSSGLARYKADRDVWLPFGNAAGIDDVDLRAVAAAGSGSERAIFAGGKGGLYLLGL